MSWIWWLKQTKASKKAFSSESNAIDNLKNLWWCDFETCVVKNILEYSVIYLGIRGYADTYSWIRYDVIERPYIFRKAYPYHWSSHEAVFVFNR